MPMSITEVTTLNSIYQVDVDAKKVRKLTGLHPPTRNQSQTDDDGWRPYDTLVPYGSGLLIIWGVEEVNGEQILRQTFTSKVLNMEGEL